MLPFVLECIKDPDALFSRTEYYFELFVQWINVIGNSFQDDTSPKKLIGEDVFTLIVLEFDTQVLSVVSRSRDAEMFTEYSMLNIFDALDVKDSGTILKESVFQFLCLLIAKRRSCFPQFLKVFGQAFFELCCLSDSTLQDKDKIPQNSCPYRNLFLICTLLGIDEHRLDLILDSYDDISVNSYVSYEIFCKILLEFLESLERRLEPIDLDSYLQTAKQQYLSRNTTPINIESNNCNDTLTPQVSATTTIPKIQLKEQIATPPSTTEEEVFSPLLSIIPKVDSVEPSPKVVTTLTTEVTHIPTHIVIESVGEDSEDRLRRLEFEKRQYAYTINSRPYPSTTTKKVKSSCFSYLFGSHRKSEGKYREYV